MKAADTARRAIDAWALLGGLVLAALVMVNVWAVLGGLLGLPFTGDVELTEMGVAIAAFMFLPYCQASRQNVRADIFTAGLGARGKRLLDAIASFVALLFAALLLWRMFLGLLDQHAYGYSTTILQVPLWWAYVPILISLGLLVLAAVLSLAGDWGGKA